MHPWLKVSLRDQQLGIRIAAPAATARLRSDFKVLAMLGSKHREMPFIYGQYFSDLQTLCHRDNRTIDEINFAVGILFQEICSPRKILRRRLYLSQLAGYDGTQEAPEHWISEFAKDQICKFGKNHIRQDRIRF